MRLAIVVLDFDVEDICGSCSPATRQNKIVIDVVDRRGGLDVKLVFERGVVDIRGEKYVTIFLAE
jgi:hypothetical protein